MPKEIRWFERRIRDTFTAVFVGCTVWIKKMKAFVCAHLCVCVRTVDVLMTQLLYLLPQYTCVFLTAEKGRFSEKLIVWGSSSWNSRQMFLFPQYQGAAVALLMCPCSSPLQMLLVSPNTWTPARFVYGAGQTELHNTTQHTFVNRS